MQDLPWPGPSRRRRRRWPLLLLVAVVVGLVAALPPLRLAAARVASKAILLVAAPLAPGTGNFGELAQTTTVVASDGSVLAQLDGAQRRQPVQLEALPTHVVRAVLAAEDANFYRHDGVDPTAVMRAVVRNAQGSTQGGSTITQQLAKLNHTKSERSLFRKLKEVLYASKLEAKYDKDTLLERYLNQVYFGEGAYGIGAAAKTFFALPPEQLDVAQAALLAGKIRAPTALDPRSRPERVRVRRDQVLRNMARHGWLDPAERQLAMSAPVQVAPEQPPPPVRAPHFVEYVKREAQGLEALGASPEARASQLFTGGYRVETTLDPEMFETTAAVVRSRLGRPKDPAVAVVSVQPGDGAVRNLFGGLNFDRKFDVATQGGRQPGSSFKPFVYLAALRAGIDPRSRLSAASPIRLSYQGQRFSVDNYEGQGQGRSDVDEALVRSINTVFAQLGLEVGPAKVLGTAEAAGIHQGIEPVPAVALGGLDRGVTPLEMAAAYATFAAKGTYARPYAIARIRDRNGRVVYRHDRDSRTAFSPEEVGVLNDPMQDVVRRGTGTAARIGRPVAGKTGTTQNYGDAWFVGYVPQLATSVWVGNPERIVPMTNVRGRRVSGGSFPAMIFADVMRAGLKELPPEPLFTAGVDSLPLRTLRGGRAITGRGSPRSDRSDSRGGGRDRRSSRTRRADPSATPTTPTGGSPGGPPTTAPSASPPGSGQSGAPAGPGGQSPPPTGAGNSPASSAPPGGPTGGT